MIPYIRKAKEGEKPEWINAKWIVVSKYQCMNYDLCETFGIAFRYWLWHMGVNPKIAFGWFNNKIKKEEDDGLE
jgi:hypothetical protein